MTQIRFPQNPGIGGLDELTTSEELVVQQIAGLGDPDADRILFWDDSAGSYKFLTAGSGLSISGTTITASGTNIFKTIAVSGQSDVVADSDTDTLTFVAGSNITITTDAATDSITITGSGVTGASTALDNLASVAINTSLLLGTSDGGALGSTTKMWSDLFLASGAVINFNNGDVTLTHSADTLTLGGGTLALGSNSLTMTGSIAATGARVTKGWFTDIESTNMPTVGGTSILTSLTAPQFTTIELGHASDTTLARVSAGVISVEGATVATLSTAQTWSALQTHSLAGNTLRLVNTTDGASVQVAKFEGDRATMADNDEAYISFLLSDDGGTQTEFSRFTWIADDVNAGTSVDASLKWSIAIAGSLTAKLVLQGSAMSPAASDGTALGTTSLMWSDLFLASGAVINFNNGDVTLTHSADTLTMAGGNLSIGTSASFTAGTIELGAASDTTISRSSAGVIAVEGVTVSLNSTSATHTAGTIELGAASDTTLSRSAAGRVAVEGVDLVDLSASQTLTNKTLTSPTLTTPSAFTTGGTITLAETHSIALDPAGSADGKWTGISVTATSGYSQSFGDLVYIDPTDSRWEAVDIDSAAGADGDARGVIGMVVSTGTDGNACTILLNGIIRADAKFPTFTVNNPIYASGTAAAVTQTQPSSTDQVIRVVGFALTTDEMYFCPSPDYITHT